MPVAEWVPAKEAARVVRVHLSTVYRWARSGAIRAEKQGHDWRVALSRDRLMIFLGAR